MNNLLLVNDDARIRDRTAVMLEELGWEVYVADTEQLVFESCVARRPCLLIVDIEMDGGAGFESIATARRLFPNLYIVAATRGGNKELWPKVAKACGANDYIVGPVAMSKLAAAIGMGSARGHTYSCPRQQ